MSKLYLLAMFTAILIVLSLTVQSSYASSPNIVISQVQLGDGVAAKNEFVEIYNNSSIDTDITDWCIYYQSSSLNQSKMACFAPIDDDSHLFLPSNSFALAVSNELSSSQSPISGDIKFSATLSGTAGYIRILDSDNLEVDRLGWGISTPEINLALTAPVGKVLSRKTIDSNTLQDTDINSDDFELVAPRTTYTYGSIYELQTTPPPPVDLCPNLDGLQTIIPDGYIIDEIGDCIVPDECSNLSGIQTIIPDGYIRGDDNDCILDLLPLKITELLPNAVGNDIGNEFIEIYNPNDTDVDLANYVFYVGMNDTKAFDFPIGLQIKAGQYLAFKNDEIKFTLVNTTSSVRLESADGTLIDETPSYTDPKEGMSWALINDVWQYTNQPTAGSLNLESIAVPDVETDTDVVEIVATSELKSCAANQYRNLETNRCNLIPTTDSTLAPCKDGQYRSEETNRCRSIASDAVELVPCAEGEERNPDTNRCRSIIMAAVLGVSDLKPCDVGQERNPDTNRCRNIVSTIPQADFAPKQTTEGSNNSVLWWSLVGVGLVAIIYGVWEWRVEIMRLVRKIRLFLHHNK